MAPLAGLALLALASASAFAAPAPASSLAKRTSSDDASPFPMALCQGLDIEDATVDDVNNWFDKKLLTTVDLVECYLARINQTNEHLHAVLALNPDALDVAKSLDAEREAGSVRGPLHGIPIIVKDNLYMAHNVSSSEGGLALLDGDYVRESFVTKKARAAGVVILGHANLAENADHRSVSNFSEAYSTRGGQTRNAFNLTQQTAGSSSGSAVGVTANLCMLAIGTETHGSILHPAGHSGTVGLKPTVGLTSRDGVIPGSYNHDTVGPLARTVKDAAYLLDAIYGVDSNDNATWLQIGKTPKDGYVAAATDKKTLAGAVYGLPWNPYWSTIGGIRAPGQFEIYMERIEQLKEAGAEIVNITMPHLLDIQNIYGWGDAQGTPWELASNRYLQPDLYNGYADYLSKTTFPEGDSRTSNYSTLADVTAWNREHNSTTGALGNSTYWFNTKTGQDYFDAAVATQGIRNQTYLTALHWRQSLARLSLDGGMVYQHSNGSVILLDGILIPNVGGGGASSSCASVPAYAGSPALTVPMGANPWKVPSGMCIYGRRWDEERLVRHGSAMEDLWRYRVKPTFAEKDTTVVPFNQRWPGYACSIASLANLTCLPNVA